MRIKTWLVVAAFFLLAGFMPSYTYASPHGRGGGGFDRDDRGEMHEGSHGGDFHSGGAYLGPYYGPGWDYGWGWNDPWIYGPSYYPNYSVQVRHGNYGTLEFSVKPKNTRVYVDRKFIGTVKELDHQKAYVAPGNHEIRLQAPDGKTMERDVYVAVGKKIKIKDRL